MKVSWLIQRLIFSIRSIPGRLLRLFFPFFHIFYARLNFYQKTAAFFFQLADLFFLFDVYEITTNLAKKSAQTSTAEEIGLGKSIFKNKINWCVVMYDRKAWSAKPHFCLAYVSFNTINTQENLTDDVFIHELTHVWQYQKFGAGYIITALAAQKSLERYNYAYHSNWLETQEFLHFNAEQQADLIQDYFLLQQGRTAQWLASPEQNPEKLSDFVRQIIS